MYTSKCSWKLLKQIRTIERMLLFPIEFVSMCHLFTSLLFICQQKNWKMLLIITLYNTCRYFCIYKSICKNMIDNSCIFLVTLVGLSIQKQSPGGVLWWLLLSMTGMKKFWMWNSIILYFCIGTMIKRIQIQTIYYVNLVFLKKVLIYFSNSLYAPARFPTNFLDQNAFVIYIKNFKTECFNISIVNA